MEPLAANSSGRSMICIGLDELPDDIPTGSFYILHWYWNDTDTKISLPINPIKLAITLPLIKFIHIAYN